MLSFFERDESVGYFDPRIEKLICTYRELSDIRPPVLFRTFLPTGYRQTTLSSVDPQFLSSVIYAKIILGMIITLYDDLADHPLHQNPTLLSKLYLLNVCADCSLPLDLSCNKERKNFELARFLFLELTKTLKEFPHFRKLKFVLQFDIEQFYSCNRYSSLVGIFPSCQNLTELRILGPHNMGIVAAGTIDLMAVEDLFFEELGACRKIFHFGQRLGRISNMIYTLQREIDEGDVTNEILTAMKEGVYSCGKYQKRLWKEFVKKQAQIRKQIIRSFNVSTYADGLVQLNHLHASLVGKI